jgi:hypothetical protein
VGERDNVQQRYCGNCGSVLAEGVQFCGNCGTRVYRTASEPTPEPDVEEPAPEQTRPQQRSLGPMEDTRTVLIVLIMLPVWMFVVAFAYVLVSTGGSSAYQLGYATAGVLIDYFIPVFAVAAFLTYLIARWARNQRRRL